MLIEQILLHILNKLQNERSITAAYYLLQGKRSGQTMQDVGLFKLFPIFNLLKKMPKRTYDMYVERLVEKRLIVRTETSFYLTEQGRNAIVPLPYYDGWHLRGNEHVFFARLALVIQTLSNQAEGVKGFVPVQKDITVQHWCRQFLLHYQFQKRALQQPLYEEMMESLESLQVPEFQKEIGIGRLHGAKVTGVTWSQLGLQHGLDELDCQLYFISFLHSWIREIVLAGEKYPLLSNFIRGVYMHQTVTGSALQTAQMYERGYSVEQIAMMRNLKQTTIEDHIVEIAMYEPNFDVSGFISTDEIRAVEDAVNLHQTKKLKVLKEALPTISYFQLKIALAKGEV